MKKIYIHHRYSDYLFKTIGHHATGIQKNINGDGEGNILFTYKGDVWEFSFQLDINYNPDGYHLIDIQQSFMSIRGGNDSKFKGIHLKDIYYENVYLIINRIDEIVSQGGEWILTFFLGEKLFFDDIISGNPIYQKLSNTMDRLTKHKLFTDNIPYKTKIPNHIFPLSNVLMFWYFRTRLLMYKEYGDLHRKIPHNYLWGYHIKRHRYRRLEIGRLLDTEKVFVSQTDWNDELVPDFKNLFEKSNIQPIKGAFYNNLVGDNDFDNKFNGYLEGDKIGFDLFFTLLPQSKGVIIDETWNVHKYKINYLSEKTYGMILARIPFVTTSIYPLDLIKYAIGGQPHPYYDTISKLEGNTTELCNWINGMVEDDLEVIQSWVDDINHILHQKVYNNNHILDNTETSVKADII